MARRKFRSRHHVVPRAVGGGGRENVVRIDDRWHRVIHETFDARHPKDYLTFATNEPDEVLARLVRSLVRHFGVTRVSAALTERRQHG